MVTNLMTLHPSPNSRIDLKNLLGLLWNRVKIHGNLGVFQIYIKFRKKTGLNVMRMLVDAVDEEKLMFRPLFFVQSNFFARATPRFHFNLVRWSESTATLVKKGVPEIVVMPVLCCSRTLFSGVIVSFIILLDC